MPDPRGGWSVRRTREPPLLLIVSGLPGSGKTTLCRRLAAELGATYLRIDTVEETMADAGVETGALGYTIAYALALDNLAAGNAVVADSVNAIEITRVAWRDVAIKAGVGALEIEIICSDPAEHKRRVEARLVGGKTGPNWTDVCTRTCEGWSRPVHRIDTAGRAEEESLRDILALVSGHRNKKAPQDEPAGPF